MPGNFAGTQSIDRRKIWNGVRSIPPSSRVSMARDPRGNYWLSLLTPAQLAELFPSYYKKELPDIGRTMLGGVSVPAASLGGTGGSSYSFEPNRVPSSGGGKTYGDSTAERAEPEKRQDWKQAIAEEAKKAEAGTSGTASNYLAERRQKYFNELDQNPKLRDEVIRIARAENGVSAESMSHVIESMVNRADMHGYDSLSKQLHDGFYGPINTGKKSFTRPLSEKEREMGEEALGRVKKGQNDIDFRTDQGMLSDPGARIYMRQPDKSGHKIVSGENYFYMGEEGKKWAKERRQEEEEYNKKKAESLGGQMPATVGTPDPSQSNKINPKEGPSLRYDPDGKPYYTPEIQEKMNKQFGPTQDQNMENLDPRLKEEMKKLPESEQQDLYKHMGKIGVGKSNEHFKRLFHENISMDGLNIIDREIGITGKGRKYGSARQGKPYEYIGVHYTGGNSLEGAYETARRTNIGYQYLIDKNGDVIMVQNPDEGRSNHWGVNNISAAKNANSVGISYVGTSGKATEAQVKAGLKLIEQVREKYGIPPENVLGHGEVTVGHREGDEGYGILKPFRQMHGLVPGGTGKPNIASESGWKSWGKAKYNYDLKNVIEEQKKAESLGGQMPATVGTPDPTKSNVITPNDPVKGLRYQPDGSPYGKETAEKVPITTINPEKVDPLTKTTPIESIDTQKKTPLQEGPVPQKVPAPGEGKGPVKPEDVNPIDVDQGKQSKLQNTTNPVKDARLANDMTTQKQWPPSQDRAMKKATLGGSAHYSHAAPNDFA